MNIPFNQFLISGNLGRFVAVNYINFCVLNSRVRIKALVFIFCKMEIMLISKHCLDYLEKYV